MVGCQVMHLSASLKVVCIDSMKSVILIEHGNYANCELKGFTDSDISNLAYGLHCYYELKSTPLVCHELVLLNCCYAPL